MSGIDEGHLALPGLTPENVHIILLAFQFVPVALLEFAPPCGSMSEPLTQFGAGRNFLDPQIDGRLCFRQAAWPEPLDEDSHAVLVGSFFVCTLQVDHARISVPFRLKAQSI